LEFLKDYDVHFQYHPGKANVVADALSCGPYPALNRLLELPSDLYEEFHMMELNVITLRTQYMLYVIEARPALTEDIRIAQAMDPQLEQIREEILEGKAPEFVIHEDGTIRFHNQVYVPAVETLKKKILDEGHNTPHSVHSRRNKLYKYLKQTFWWSNMKQKVAEYVAKCLTSQRVKIEHQQPAGLLQLLDIPAWKWDSVSMDFVVRLPLTQKKNNAIWVIVDRFTKMTHFIAMRNTWTLDQLAQAYLEEIVKLHGVPSSIVSD